MSIIETPVAHSIYIVTYVPYPSFSVHDIMVALPDVCRWLKLQRVQVATSLHFPPQKSHTNGNRPYNGEWMLIMLYSACVNGSVLCTIIIVIFKFFCAKKRMLVIVCVLDDED